MSNATAMARLNERIRRIATLPAALPEIAQVVVGEVRSILASNVAAQRGPDGTAWPRTNSGDPALVNAMAAVDVRAVGSTVVISVDGVEDRHHRGRVKGGRRRDIIPSRSTPEPIEKALDRATQSTLTRHMDGA